MSCAAMADLTVIQIAFPLLIFFPTLALYLLIMHSIYKSSVFHHPFFYYIVILSVINILFWISNYLLDRFIQLPFVCSFVISSFSKPTYYLTPIFYPYFYCPFAQFCCVLLMVLNRSAMIFMPLSAASMWKKYFQGIFIIQLLVPFCFSCFTLGWKGYIKFLDGTHLLVDYEKPFSIFTNPIISLFGAAITCLIIIATAATLIRLFQIRLLIVHRNHMEIKLFFTALFFALTTLLFSCQQIALYYFLSLNPDDARLAQMQNLKGPVVDIATLLPPWIFLLLNFEIREKLYAFVKARISFAPERRIISMSK